MQTKISLQQLDKEIIEYLSEIDNFKQYVDDRIEQLIGTSPENLDTIEELVNAILDNQDVVDAINEAMTNKVDKIKGKGLSTNDLTDELVKKWNDKSDFSGSYKDLKDIPNIGDATPIGEIITYMGTKAPVHYLICDGSEYMIEDYVKLAQHFIDNFGSVNYFGGDGIETFAVPDLRGEFLRGTGTAKRNTGSGAEVGIHQEPTKQIRIGYNTNVPSLWLDSSLLENGVTTASVSNQDTIIKTNSTVGREVRLTNWSGAGGYSQFTARPTNTSVLYCIKYESISFKPGEEEQDVLRIMDLEDVVNDSVLDKSKFNIAK